MTTSPIVMHPIPNYGDLINIPLLTHYLKATRFTTYHKIPVGEKAIIGCGTLIDYIIPAKWFQERECTFVGTGANLFHQPIRIKGKGFVRGWLSHQKTGLRPLGDIGLLVDRVFRPSPIKTGKTLLVIDKYLGEVESPLFEGAELGSLFPVSIPDLEAVFQKISEASHVITDRLHIAMTAEALGIPWVIWNHGKGDIAQTPYKFIDWAGTIGKERFCISRVEDLEIMETNTHFFISLKQKEALEEELRNICDAV